jgi:hypothetical protein
MTKSQIKELFKEQGVQLGAGTMEQIQYELAQYVGRMATRSAEGNLKRLTPELFWIAMGRLNND